MPIELRAPKLIGEQTLADYYRTIAENNRQRARFEERQRAIQAAQMQQAVQSGFQRSYDRQDRERQFEQQSDLLQQRDDAAMERTEYAWDQRLAGYEAKRQQDLQIEAQRMTYKAMSDAGYVLDVDPVAASEMARLNSTIPLLQQEHANGGITDEEFAREQDDALRKIHSMAQTSGKTWRKKNPQELMTPEKLAEQYSKQVHVDEAGMYWYLTEKGTLKPQMPPKPETMSDAEQPAAAFYNGNQVSFGNIPQDEFNKQYLSVMKALGIDDDTGKSASHEQIIETLAKMNGVRLPPSQVRIPQASQQEQDAFRNTFRGEISAAPKHLIRKSLMDLDAKYNSIDEMPTQERIMAEEMMRALGVE